MGRWRGACLLCPLHQSRPHEQRQLLALEKVSQLLVCLPLLQRTTRDLLLAKLAKLIKIAEATVTWQARQPPFSSTASEQPG